MERGDTGPGRDAYGPPVRERAPRGYGPRPYPADDGYPPSADYEEDDAAGPGRPVDVEEDDYGQLLRGPGEMPPRQRLRQPGRRYPGQPGRLPPTAPPNAGPGPAAPPNGQGHGGMPGHGVPHGPAPHGPAPHGAAPHGAAPHGSAPHAGPQNGTPHADPVIGDGLVPDNAPAPSGEPAPGRQYRLPNGRRLPPSADRLYRPAGPGMPGGTSGRHHGPGPAADQDPYTPRRSRPGPAPGVPSPGAGPGSPAPGGSVPGGHGGAAHGGSVPGGHGGGAHGGTASGTAHRGTAHGGAQPYGGPGASGIPPLREHPPAGSRFDAPDGRDRLAPPPEPPGPVIRQREAAVPDQPSEAAQAVVSIAPDGLEAFARDLRALRAQANLDYPEMAEVSHYEMKTLAAAAGGLRLPSLPVTVAFVRACDGDVAEWEERWQKLAGKLTAEAARKRKNDGEENLGPVEPADAPAALEPPARRAATPPADSDGSEVYVITSAKPRQPGW